MRRLSKLSVRAYLSDDRVAVGSLLLPGKMGESLLLAEGAGNSGEKVGSLCHWERR